MITLGRAGQTEIDQAAAEQLGLSGLILMEHAALALVREIRAFVADQRPERFVFLCGPGNNGGDAYAAARLLLDDGIPIDVYESEERAAQVKGSDADLNRAILLNLGIDIQPFSAYEARRGDLVIDAIFGTAFRLERGIQGEYLRLMQMLAEQKSTLGLRIISVDIPSGVEADTGLAHEVAVRADLTVSFIAPKTGIVAYPGRMYAGTVRIGSLNLPKTWLDKKIASQGWRGPREIDLEALRLRAAETRRSADSHKGTNGHVALMAGSPGMGGAAVLAARAAIASGSGLVSLNIPADLYAAALNAVPSALIHILPETTAEQVSWWSAQIGKKDAVAIGPGLGQVDDHRPYLDEMIFTAIREAKRLVLDADALNIIAAPERAERAQALLRERVANGMEAAVLTPHPGEARRLLGEEAELAMTDRLQAAKVLAERWSSVIVLKGAGTVVHLPAAVFGESEIEDHVWINSSGNPGMGKGGSGDLLTGILASFLGQGMSLETAVIGAVFLHGRAADLAVGDGSERGLMPEMFLQYIGRAGEEVAWE